MEFRVGSWILITVLITLFFLTLVKYQLKTIKRLKKQNAIKNKIIMEMTLEQNVEHLVTVVDRINTDVQTIKRGLYGDEDNKYPGLIDRQKRDEERIEALESHNKKDALKKKWWAAAIAGVIGIIEGIIHLAKTLK